MSDTLVAPARDPVRPTFIAVAKLNWRTSLTGLGSLAAALALSFGDTSKLFGGVSANDVAAVVTTWPQFLAHWGAVFGLVASGVGALLAKDGAVHGTPATRANAPPQA